MFLSRAVARLAVLGLAVKYPRNARQKAAQRPVGAHMPAWCVGMALNLLCVTQAVRFYRRNPNG